MNAHDDKQLPGRSTEESGQEPATPKIPEDHPGMQKISKNPNPRANENLTGAGSDVNIHDEEIADQTGSEITDGEDG